MADDICRICGKEGPLSFEHIPPQSVGNDHTVKLYSGVDAVKSSLTGQDDMEGLKYRQLQRGQGFKTICSSCNSYLGQNYVKPFSEFYRATDSKSLSLTFRKGINPFISRQIGSCLLHL